MSVQDNSLYQSILENLVPNYYGSNNYSGQNFSPAVSNWNPIREALFRLQYNQMANNYPNQVPKNPNSPNTNYNMRGFISDPESLNNINSNDNSIHWSGKYKNINHPSIAYNWAYSKPFKDEAQRIETDAIIRQFTGSP